MKKSKILLVTVLALVLCLLCVTTSTFSWLPRPNYEKGNALAWSPSYETSVGKDISMQTFELTEDGKEPETPQEVTAFSNAAGLAPGSRKYYRTDIANAGTDAQSVSLYLSSLNLAKKDGSFHLGVNSPLRTYKSYPQNNGSGSVNYTKASSETVRIYFQPNNVTSWKDDSTVIKIRCGTNADTSNPNFDDSNPITMTHIENSSPKTLFADIPISAKICQIYANDSKDGANATPYMILKDYCPKLSVTKSYRFVLQSNTDGYNNHNCDTYEESNGANIANYYSSIKITQKGTFSAGLTKGTDYSGNKIEYYSGNASVFTVDKSTGKITLNTNAAVGATAKLYTKVIGAYGKEDSNSDKNDQKQVETTITVTASSKPTDTLVDVPVVTNVKVAGATGEGADRKSTVVSVYWYIKNEGSDTLTYTIDDVYLTL